MKLTLQNIVMILTLSACGKSGGGGCDASKMIQGTYVDAGGSGRITIHQCDFTYKSDTTSCVIEGTFPQIDTSEGTFDASLSSHTSACGDIPDVTTCDFRLVTTLDMLLDCDVGISGEFIY